ncbi:uncharacterized protein LOC120143152 [Hibiscus syriacus]|uniref:uncharacterized protein LOC120143152 n=1 Tax=Hibiscus syriacus TaxID=106335 RepID=UPI00192295E8|nr:uncharacterized protein LOC120143152 [Hibiscus syriacus]
MTEKEVEKTLLAQAKILPSFTKFVWEKLEQENEEFFRAYYMRLMVKQQIIEFNQMLQQHVQLMHQIYPTGVCPNNGPHLSHVPPSSSGYADGNKGKAPKEENMQQGMRSNLPNVFGNSSGSSLNTEHHAGRFDDPSAMVSTQSANMGLMQNGKMDAHNLEGSSHDFL